MTDRLDNFKGKNVKGFKKWLILSHGFNMDGRAASLTVTDKIPCLLREGIRLHVLSAITGSKDTRFPHQQLIAWGPAAFRFDFRHWFANRFGRNIAYKIITTLVSVILAPFILIEKLLFGCYFEIASYLCLTNFLILFFKSEIFAFLYFLTYEVNVYGFGIDF